MQKKIIALAIASALVVPAAFADTSNVTVYGVLNADFESVKNSNVGTVAAPISNSLNRIATNASRFGIKGAEDLGQGLSAIWQYEAQFDLNGNGTGGSGFGNGTRNSNVGLKGDFGTAFLGIWDTPMKVVHNKVELFDNTTIATSGNVLGRTGNAGVNFNNRLKNSFQYWTPNMSGFEAKLAYGTDNGQTTTAGITPVTASKNQSVVSLSATYENDMFYAGYGFERFKDLTLATNLTAAGDKADGNRLVGAYKFDGGLVGLTYEKLGGTTAGLSNSRRAWELAAKYSMGANNFGLSYVKAGNTNNALSSGAKQLSLRYGYSFSKRTEMYGMYTALQNETNGAYNLSGGTSATVLNNALGTTIGSKLSGFGVGMIHSF
jgi:predicted porin